MATSNRTRQRPAALVLFRHASLATLEFGETVFSGNATDLQPVLCAPAFGAACTQS